jgi:hypothetical protein
MNPNKRIVFVTGDKGGVGKSFTARALVEYYLSLGIPFHAYDIDPVNPSLAQFYPEVTTAIDLEEPGALDELRNDMEVHPLLLVDCAARSINELDHWFSDMSLLQQRKNLKLSITFAFVVTPDKSCTVIMQDALKRFSEEAHYFVVKNTGKGKNFSIYEKSALRKTFLSDFQGREIDLPPILERTVVLLDNHDIAFGKALNDPHATYADRSRVQGFLDKVFAEFKTLHDWLVPEAS